MSRPLLLDLFCCQGGAAAGYHAAGFDVVGVDITRQPRYPYRFLHADALVLLRAIIARTAPGDLWRRLVAVHASCPCQAHTLAQKLRGNDHPDLIAPTRGLLNQLGLPYVIENVPGAPLKDPVELCGAPFGLRTYRHRLFETNWTLEQPAHPEHVHPTVKMGRRLREGDWYHAVGNMNLGPRDDSGVAYVKRDMGVPWMSRDGVRECIPPAYTQWIGKRLREVVGS